MSAFDLNEVSAPAPVHIGPVHTPRRGRLRRFASDRLACASLGFILLIVAVSIAAPWIAPHDPVAADPAHRLAPIGSPGYLLGADAQGRDVLSRLIWGGRFSLQASIVPVFLAVTMSLALGLLAGYFGGRWSAALMRGIDLLFAFPMVMVAIGLAAVLGPGLWTVALTVVLSITPYLLRVVYADVKAERDKDYVEAARALGASTTDILAQEILPNVVTSSIVYGTTLVGGMIVFIAGLSFLGLVGSRSCSRTVRPRSTHAAQSLTNFAPRCCGSGWRQPVGRRLLCQSKRCIVWVWSGLISIAFRMSSRAGSANASASREPCRLIPNA